MKVPYPMQAAVSDQERHNQMAIATMQGFDRLQQSEMHGGTLTIACYGPSLADTWQNIKGPVLSVSGAHDFLIERGIIPTWHADMDPRPHKAKHLEKPHKDVEYLMATVCHPSAWKRLKGYNVKLWHVISSKHTYEWVARFDGNNLLVAGGSAIGLAAVHLGGVLGFRHFEIHGMDGSYKDGTRHAGEHFGHVHKSKVYEFDGREFRSSKIMMNSLVEFINMAKGFPFFAVMHGDGLLQSIVEKIDLENVAVAGTYKASVVRTGEVKFIEQAAA